MLAARQLHKYFNNSIKTNRNKHEFEKKKELKFQQRAKKKCTFRFPSTVQCDSSAFSQNRKFLSWKINLIEKRIEYIYEQFNTCIWYSTCMNMVLCGHSKITTRQWFMLYLVSAFLFFSWCLVLSRASGIHFTSHVSSAFKWITIK